MIGKEYSTMVNQQNSQIEFIAPLTGAWEFMPNLGVFIPEWRKDLLELIRISHINNWDIGINFRKQLQEYKKAIVVTDLNQIILWTSSYFKEMTGYEREEAIGKRPSFLQGENTSSVTREKIRNAIRNREIAIEELVNYKKDGTPYNCLVKIIPVYNHDKKLVNFIALEKDVN